MVSPLTGLPAHIRACTGGSRQEETDVGGWLLPRDPQVVPGAVLGGSNMGLARCTEPSSRQRTAAVPRWPAQLCCFPLASHQPRAKDEDPEI